MANGSVDGKLKIEVEVSDKNAIKSLNDLSKTVDNVNRKVKASSKSVAESRRNAGQYIEQFKKDLKVKPYIDFSNISKDLKKYEKQAISAKNKINGIMASSSPDKQLKGLERYTIELQTARSAIKLLKEEENRRNEAYFNWKPRHIEAQEEVATTEKAVEQSRYVPSTYDPVEAQKQRDEVTNFINNYVSGFNKIGEKAKELSVDLENFLDFEPTVLKEGQTYTKEYTKLASEIQKAETKLENLYTKQEQMSSAKPGTERYQKLQTDIKKAELELDGLNLKMKDLQESGGDVSSVDLSMQNFANTTKNVSTTLSGIADVFRNAGLGNLSQMFNRASQSAGDMSRNLKVASEGGTEISGAFTGLSEAMPVIAGITIGVTALSTAFKAVKNVIVKVANSIVSVFKKISSVVGDVVKSFLSLGQYGGRSSNILLRNIQRVFMALSSRLRSLAITAVTKDMGASFDNLAAYSQRLGTQLAQLKAILSTLGGQFLAAFEPIMNYALPALISIANAALYAMNAISQLIAVLTGQSTYIKANTAIDGISSSLGGASGAAKDLKQQLQGFDELNVLTTDNKGGGGGGGGGGNTSGSSYETVPVNEMMQNLGDRIKSAWENADFTFLGELLGTKIRDALLSINWKKIQKTSGKVGKSLATLINGLISVNDLAKSFGTTIGNAINTVIEFIDNFVSFVNWSGIGTFISKGINGALDTIKWDKMVSIAGKIGNGLSTIINTLLRSDTISKIGHALSSVINAGIEFFKNLISIENFSILGVRIGELITQMFEEINWKDFGRTMSNLCVGLLSLITNAIKSIDYKTVGDAMVEFLGSIDWTKLFISSVKLLSALHSAFTQLLVQAIKAVGEVKVEILLNVVTTVAQLLAQISSVINGVGAVYVNALVGLVKNGWDKVASWVSQYSGGVVNSLVGLIKNGWNTISQWVSNFIGGAVGALIGLQRHGWTTVAQWVTSQIGGVVKVTVDLVRGNWNNIKKFFGLSEGGIVGANGGVKLFANGGAISSSGVKCFAGGLSNGLPDHGTLFAAGENGSEIVGHIGGRTEVLNRSQIAATMYESVTSANAEQNAILRRQNTLLQAILEKETGISANELYNSVVNSDREQRLRTGRSQLAY